MPQTISAEMNTIQWRTLLKEQNKIYQQAPVVQEVDTTIHWVNVYPLNSAAGFPNTCPLDSDLSCGYLYIGWITSCSSGNEPVLQPGEQREQQKSSLSSIQHFNNWHQKWQVVHLK